MIQSPFLDVPATDVEDRECVRLAQEGDRRALELLIGRHQRWIYNLALRMVYHPEDAEDATQEILIRVITKLSTFQGRSSFRTWLYRLVVNHMLNMKRRGREPVTLSFDEYGRGLTDTPDLDLPDPKTVPADVQLLVEEAKIGCTSGMLLCLDREQRLVYILGEILGVSDTLGAELLETSRDNFRQKLSRARRDLHRFMHGQCGLINAANPCRCAKKVQGFIKAGYLNPERPLFARAHVVRIREVAPKRVSELEALDEDYAEIHRSHPFQDGPDFIAAMRAFITGPGFTSALDTE